MAGIDSPEIPWTPLKQTFAAWWNRSDAEERRSRRSAHLEGSTMTNAGWQPIATAPEEVKRNEPVLLLVHSISSDPVRSRGRLDGTCRDARLAEAVEADRDHPVGLWFLRFPGPLPSVACYTACGPQSFLGDLGLAGVRGSTETKVMPRSPRVRHALHHGCRAGPICGARTGFAIPKKIVTP